MAKNEKTTMEKPLKNTKKERLVAAIEALSSPIFSTINQMIEPISN